MSACQWAQYPNCEKVKTYFYIISDFQISYLVFQVIVERVKRAHSLCTLVSRNSLGPSFSASLWDFSPFSQSPRGNHYSLIAQCEPQQAALINGSDIHQQTLTQTLTQKIYISLLFITTHNPKIPFIFPMKFLINRLVHEDSSVVEGTSFVWL